MEMNPMVGILILGALFFLPRFLKKKSTQAGGSDDGFLGEALDNLTELSSQMSKAGFKLMPQLADALMKNDRSYVDRLIRQLMLAFKDPEQRHGELEEVFTRLLDEKFKDPQKRRALLDRIEQLKAADLAKPSA